MKKVISTPFVKRIAQGKWAESEQGTHQAVVVDEDGKKTMHVLSRFDFGIEGAVTVENCSEATTKTYFYKDTQRMYPISNNQRVTPEGLTSDIAEENTIGLHDFYVSLMKKEVAVFDIQKQFLIKEFGA